MVDFKILEDIKLYGWNDENLEKRYISAPFGLFYVKGTGDIAPIAIQFHQETNETNPIWTPNDSELDWTFAKMWLRTADVQWHQVSISGSKTTICNQVKDYKTFLPNPTCMILSRSRVTKNKEEEKKQQ